jgi:hypothetical protein
MAPTRIIAPSADAWAEVTLIAGILARIQAIRGKAAGRFPMMR